jgi:hypothetical protein
LGCLTLSHEAQIIINIIIIIKTINNRRYIIRVNSLSIELEKVRGA